MKTHTSQTLAQTEQVAHEWLAEVAREYKDSPKAFVVGLSGNLGAGKTSFTKYVARILGIHEEITSPTFVIMKIYEINNSQIDKTLAIPWKRLVHIDAYRLEHREELEILEWNKLIADKNNLILVEWPENVGLSQFSEFGHLVFDVHGEQRTIQIT
jgi:tRNA threonylcarbamoyladenosine biosynthesis protein TsaE